MPSSVIKRYLYDATKQELAVTFPSGKTYIYEDVPHDVFVAFGEAESRGAYFNDHIRDRFYHREL